MLMVLVAVQESLFDGRLRWQWPLYDELLAMALATGVAVSRWRAGPALDALLPTPRRWLEQSLKPLWWLAPVFVVLLYALRHATRALLGETYPHAPWPAVFGYACLKFAVFYALLTGVQFAQRSHHALAAERLRAVRAEQLSAQARLLQLTQQVQQVQPHFLFNASWWVDYARSLMHWVDHERRRQRPRRPQRPLISFASATDWRWGNCSFVGNR